jgi:ABC-type iron transport system FetAB ATPase subunit
MKKILLISLLAAVSLCVSNTASAQLLKGAKPYLTPDQLPNMVNWLPEPPTEGSAAFECNDLADLQAVLLRFNVSRRRYTGMLFKGPRKIINIRIPQRQRNIRYVSAVVAKHFLRLLDSDRVNVIYR